eukprot:scaffold3135_cov352-Prasinococcus_capsulatus_cf.AAC.7
MARSAARAYSLTAAAPSALTCESGLDHSHDRRRRGAQRGLALAWGRPPGACSTERTMNDWAPITRAALPTAADVLIAMLLVRTS